jgi:hypothetical protein
MMWRTTILFSEITQSIISISRCPLNQSVTAIAITPTGSATAFANLQRRTYKYFCLILPMIVARAFLSLNTTILESMPGQRSHFHYTLYKLTFLLFRFFGSNLFGRCTSLWGAPWCMRKRRWRPRGEEESTGSVATLVVTDASKEQGYCKDVLR